MSTYRCWLADDQEEDDGGDVTAFDAEDAGTEYAEAAWKMCPDYAIDGVSGIDVMVKDEAGNVVTVAVTVDWDPVFTGRLKKEEAK